MGIENTHFPENGEALHIKGVVTKENKADIDLIYYAASGKAMSHTAQNRCKETGKMRTSGGSRTLCLI